MFLALPLGTSGSICHLCSFKTINACIEKPFVVQAHVQFLSPNNFYFFIYSTSQWGKWVVLSLELPRTHFSAYVEFPGQRCVSQLLLQPPHQEVRNSSKLFIFSGFAYFCLFVWRHYHSVYRFLESKNYSFFYVLTVTIHSFFHPVSGLFPVQLRFVRCTTARHRSKARWRRPMVVSAIRYNYYWCVFCCFVVLLFWA